MTTKKAFGALAMAALLVLAGCSSAVPGSNSQVQTTQADGGDGATTDGSTSADLTFYVSDRPGAIEDFEHLNVTITKIGLHKTSGDDGADDGDETESANDTTADDANADAVQTTTVEDPNETTVTMTTTESTETETETEEPEESETEEPEESETEEPEESETEESEESETEESEDAESEESEETEESEDAEKEGWVMKDVDDETVDLTKLKGANATAIGNLSVSAGEYDKVFVYVSDINATLENGESVNVKLPSEKLQINKAFTISENSTPDFVFDINVHKAGNSGKYILRPIVSESGTGDQVEIEKVDKNGKPENPGANGKDKGDDDDEDDDSETESEAEDDESDGERTLEATIQGAVRAGENVTLAVTDGDGAVANATVTVNDEVVGETNADGTLTFEVPDDDELEVTVESDDAEVELERKIKGGGGGNSFEPYALV